jgi:hypothetical protein
MRLERKRHYLDESIAAGGAEAGWTSGPDDAAVFIFPSADGSVWHAGHGGPSAAQATLATEAEAVAWARGTGVRRILIDRTGDRAFQPLDD